MDSREGSISQTPDVIIIETDQEVIASEDSAIEVQQNQQSESTNNTTIEANNQDPDERPNKRPKLDDTTDEDGALCVICFEIWDQVGDHRIASLKCGHCFGHKCIARWLLENKLCPTCKAKANKRDIRFIYANKLIARDTGELTKVQAELEAYRVENITLQTEVTSVRCMLALKNAELDKCKFQIEQLKTGLSVTVGAKTTEQSFCLKHTGSFVICPQASCRVMDFIHSKTTIVASMKSGNSLFAGFGVKHLNSENFRQLSYTPLHTKAIRDLQFNQQSATLLSVSLDKHFSIATIYSSDNKIKQCTNDMLWSCCWDASNSNIFYVGGQQGAVKIFDSRYITDSALFTLNIDGDLSPVVSISSIPSGAGNAMPQGGFVACKLSSLWAFEDAGGTYKPHLLPIEGPFVSMVYNKRDKHLLVSARPNARESTARHIVCGLSREAGVLSCNRVHTLSSGRMQRHLTRSCFLEKDNVSYVATPNDTTVQLWNSQTGYPVAAGRTTGPIIDLLPVMNTDGLNVLALTEKKLNVFRITDS